MSVATSTAIALGTAAAATATGIYGATKQADSAAAANTTTATANAAALKQAEAQQQMQYEEFNQQQALAKAQYDAQQQLRAPYRAAGANALSSLGGILGVNFGAGYTPAAPDATPSSTPVPLPNAAGDTTPTSPAPTTSPTSANPTDPAAIMAALQHNYAAIKVAPGASGSGAGDIAYYAQKIADTGGLTPQNTAYWFGPSGRIASDAAKAGGGSTSPASTPPLPMGALAPQMGTITNAFAPAPGIVPIRSVLGY